MAFSDQELDTMLGFWMIHEAFRKDFVLLEKWVGEIGEWPESRRQKMLPWFAFHRNQIHHHHLGEDLVVFPLLIQKLPFLGEGLDHLSQDHVHLDGLLDRVERALRALVGNPRETSEGVAAIAAYVGRVRPHLGAEESLLLPAVAHHLGKEGFAEIENAYLTHAPLEVLQAQVPWMMDATQAKWADRFWEKLPPALRLKVETELEPAFRQRMPVS